MVTFTSSSTSPSLSSYSRLALVLLHLSANVAGFGSTTSSTTSHGTTPPTTESTTSHGHGHGADASSANLIQSMTNNCQLEDLALGACSLEDFCATLRANGKDAECAGDYFTEWTVTVHDPLTCYPPGLAMSFTAYPFNASTWDDDWAMANGHACRTASDIHTFQQDTMVLAARVIHYERPLPQAGRLDWTSPVHVCEPREHQHYTDYARTKAFCMSACLNYAVNQQPCKEECSDCGVGNQPYDCTNVDPSLIPSCYSFYDFRGNFLNYFQKLNTQTEEGTEPIPPEVDEEATTELTFTRPGVEPCFTPDNPPSCQGQSDNRRNLFGFGGSSSSNTNANEDAVTACNDMEVLFLSGIQFDRDLHFKAFQGLGTDSGFCSMVQQYYDQCYWCAPEITIEQDDQYCATLETFCNEEPPLIDDTVNATETCDQVSYWLDYFTIYPNTVDLCHRAEHSLHSGQCPKVCGRDKEALRSPFRPSKRSLPAKGIQEGDIIDEDYLGANTEAKKKALVWLTRTSAFLSFLGSCYILYDILRHKGRCQNNVYYQLLAAMAIFDLCTAAAWSLATHPLPLPQAGYIYGASGNELSCTVQGFFVQLGFTSVFYNVSLSAYYVLVIARGWREADLKQIQTWLHALPLLVGVGLAFGGLPVYDWIEYGCMMPIHERWSALVFGVVPLGFSIFIITASMFWIYFGVRKTARKSGRWALRASTVANQSLESRVFWQALLYAMSFYITWPLLFAVYLWSIDITFDSFALSSIIAFTAPLQGFTDFLVYIRPKVATRITPSMQWLSDRSREFFFGSSAFVPSTKSSTTGGNSSTADEEAKSRRMREELKDLDPSVMIASDIQMPDESAPAATDDEVAVPVGHDDKENDNSNNNGQPQYHTTDDEAGSFSTTG